MAKPLRKVFEVFNSTLEKNSHQNLTGNLENLTLVFGNVSLSSSRAAPFEVLVNAHFFLKNGRKEPVKTFDDKILFQNYVSIKFYCFKKVLLCFSKLYLFCSRPGEPLAQVNAAGDLE